MLSCVFVFGMVTLVNTDTSYAVPVDKVGYYELDDGELFVITRPRSVSFTIPPEWQALTLPQVLDACDNQAYESLGVQE